MPALELLSAAPSSSTPFGELNGTLEREGTGRVVVGARVDETGRSRMGLESEGKATAE